MLYRLIRKLFKIALFIFFKKIVVSGKKNIPVSGPVIIVSNHPNTFLDPLLIAKVMKRRIGFVANASIYSVKFLTPIFDFFHVIPIYRKEDVLPGEKQDNTGSFSKCHEYLNKGNSLLIFPEGSSYHELKLREIKSGTARIALSFEELNHFESGLKILPVTLDYSDSLQFQSMISIVINPVITVDNYRNLYAENENSAFDAITEDIRRSLAKNIPQTSGKEQEDFLIKVHKFYTTYSEPDADLYVNPKRSLVLRNQISGVMNSIEKDNPTLYNEIKTEVNNFFRNLRTENLTSGFFTDEFAGKNKIAVTLGYLSIFLLVLPIYLLGILCNYIPYILPAKIFRALKIEIEYKSSVQLVLGIFTFPIYYSLIIYLFSIYISSDVLNVLIFSFLIPVSGYIAMFYWTESKRFARVVRFYFFISKEKQQEILNLRDKILARINEARKSLD